MGIFSNFFSLFSTNSINDIDDIGSDIFDNSSESIFDDSINPANGLPMLGDGGFDIEGNSYGTDSSHDDMFADSSSLFDDEF